MSVFYCEAHDRQEDADFVGYNVAEKGDRPGREACDDCVGCVPGWTMDDEGAVYDSEDLAQEMMTAKRLAQAAMWAKLDQSRNEQPINGPEAEKGTWGNP